MRNPIGPSELHNLKPEAIGGSYLGRFLHIEPCGLPSDSRVWNPVDAVSPRTVFRMANPLQILNAIVQLVSVNVVNFVAFWLGRAKMFHHKNMDVCLKLFATLPEIHFEVSCTSLRSFYRQVRTHTANISEFADFVKPFKSLDRLPLFSHAIKVHHWLTVCQGGVSSHALDW